MLDVMLPKAMVRYILEIRTFDACDMHYCSLSEKKVKASQGSIALIGDDFNKRDVEVRRDMIEKMVPQRS
ncbi:hypothetical protein V6N12_032832 [Hibiscus sabdariffa]|uniref:Uncharacterized protein n=1 Tax=Hibiscus sabdariffa TaxID=183260 RepID=A0ABR2AHL2_9ROSI